MVIGVSARYRDSPSSFLESNTEGVDESSIEIVIDLADETIDHYIDSIIFIYSDIEWISYRVGDFSDLESDKSYIRDSLRQLLASHLIAIEH